MNNVSGGTIVWGIEVVFWVFALPPMLWGIVREVRANRCGSRVLGWGAIGFMLLVVGVCLAIDGTLALQLFPESMANNDLKAQLNVITLIASVVFGGLGTNLLAHWLTSQTSPPSPASPAVLPGPTA